MEEEREGSREEDMGVVHLRLTCNYNQDLCKKNITNLKNNNDKKNRKKETLTFCVSKKDYFSHKANQVLVHNIGSKSL